MSETKFKDVDWQKEIEEYMALGRPTINSFVQDKHYSAYAFKYHLYKDPDYPRKQKKHADQEGASLLPVVVVPEKEKTVLVINGFTLTVDESTLIKILATMRQL